MAREAKRVPIRSPEDVIRVLEDVNRDHEPRIIEREGKAMAAVIDVDDLNKVISGTPPVEDVAGGLAASGSWSDVDADALKRRIYEGRKGGSRPTTYRQEERPERPVDLLCK